MVDRAGVHPAIPTGRLRWVMRFCAARSQVPPLAQGCLLTLRNTARLSARVISILQRSPQTKKTWRREGHMFKMQEELTYEKRC